MDIFSFHKLTRPVYEGGLTIDSCPQGKFLVEVRRADGTIRRPFGDHLIDNTFLNQWRDGQLGGVGTTSTGTQSVFGWGTGGAITTRRTWLDLFYGNLSCIAVGSGSASASATNTALATAVRFDSVPSSGGNAATWSQTTGDVVYTIKEEFPTETGSVTYREAGIRINSAFTTGSGLNGLEIVSGGQEKIINRVVFPADVVLATGEQLILTIAVTVPTLASTAGKTVTIGAQNGMNISGQLRVITDQTNLVGGTINSSNGSITTSGAIGHPALFSPNLPPSGILSTKTAFDTQGTAPSWGLTGVVNGSWGSYTNGAFARDVAFTWPNGTPSTNFAFRSILMRSLSTNSALGGYQLLLDNEMTKASAGVLSFSLRFSV